MANSYDPYEPRIRNPDGLYMKWGKMPVLSAEERAEIIEASTAPPSFMRCAYCDRPVRDDEVCPDCPW